MSLNDAERLVVREVREHATYWRSDMAKRVTVEKHLTEKDLQGVSVVIDNLINRGVLERIPRPRGEYLRVRKPKFRLLIRIWVKQDKLYDTAKQAMEDGRKAGAAEEDITTMEEWSQ